MSVVKKIEEWILEYACKHGAERVIQELCKKSPHWAELAHVCQVPLALRTIKNVIHLRDIEYYSTVSEIIEHFFSETDLLTFETYAKIGPSLNVLVILEKIKSKDSNTHEVLAKYFPRTSARHPKAETTSFDRYCKQVAKFRQIAFHLLANRKSRSSLDKQHVKEYGEEFYQRLRRHSDKFVEKAFGKLSPVIERIRHEDEDSVLMSKLTSHSSVLIQYLLDITLTENGPSEEDLLDFLKVIYSNDGPSNGTQDNPYRCFQASQGFQYQPSQETGVVTSKIGKSTTLSGDKGKALQSKCVKVSSQESEKMDTTTSSQESFKSCQEEQDSEASRESSADFTIAYGNTTSDNEAVPSTSMVYDSYPETSFEEKENNVLTGNAVGHDLLRYAKNKSSGSSKCNYIPKISTHLMHVETKQCVVKLFWNQDSDIRDKNQTYKMYS